MLKFKVLGVFLTLLQGLQWVLNLIGAFVSDESIGFQKTVEKKSGKD